MAVAKAAKSRHSGLQKHVLKLYRECMAAAQSLPTDARPAARLLVRREFKEKARTVDRLDIQRIEFLMRQARRKVETYTMPGVVGVGASAVAQGGEGAKGAGAGAVAGGGSAGGPGGAGSAAAATPAAAAAPPMR